MPEMSRLVSVYMKELRKTRKEKPKHVREALETYIQLWEDVIRKGLVRPWDEIDFALKEIEAHGGLYRAAQD